MTHPPLHIIATMHSDFPEKFGIPRQSGIVPALRGRIVFEPEYRDPQCFRGLDAFTHLWLLWGFSRAGEWSPTVRPPRLGGNRRVGVFASRSPFRPNAVGLSSVRLERIEQHPAWGIVLHVSGADLMDGSPIYDIKPYLPYTDCHPEATGGYAEDGAHGLLQVVIPPQWLACVPGEHVEALRGVLANDPRPSYQQDPARLYGMAFAGMEVKFTVDGELLTVRRIDPMGDAPPIRR